MLAFIFEYLKNREMRALSAAERMKLERAIQLFLYDNGIGENQADEYFRQYVKRQLDRIDTDHLKQYWQAYPKIRKIRQIIVESRESVLPDSRKKQLEDLVDGLTDMGLGDKYLPAAEIEQILGRHMAV